LDRTLTYERKAEGLTIRLSAATERLLHKRLYGLKIHRCFGIILLLDRAAILIAEDKPFIALDLAFAIEDAGGEVIGPAASVKDALLLLQHRVVTRAILDVNLTELIVRIKATQFSELVNVLEALLQSAT
jgi:hypothetical protein